MANRATSLAKDNLGTLLYLDILLFLLISFEKLMLVFVLASDLIASRLFIRRHFRGAAKLQSRLITQRNFIFLGPTFAKRLSDRLSRRLPPLSHLPPGQSTSSDSLR